MVCFKVEVGLQTRFFVGESFAQVVQQAVAAQVPAQALKAGQFFEAVQLGSDSRAQALLDAL
jgi:hypothetical protein